MHDDARDNHSQMIERAEIANLVRSRMDSLNLPPIDYDDVSKKRSSLSYVIINPSCDLKLEEGDIIYIVRPSPFSAQKTFERHNSRRKSNISFCSQSQQFRSRRGSGLGFPSPLNRPPPLVTTKSNSLSLPDSPTVASSLRGRSNSLRVIDDILLRRSNSLRQKLCSTPRKSSLEELGVSHYPLSMLSERRPSIQLQSSDSNSIKIALNGSIDLKVTPPKEVGSPSISSNTGLVVVPPPPSAAQMPPHSHHPSPSSPVAVSSSTDQLQGTIV